MANHLRFLAAAAVTAIPTTAISQKPPCTVGMAVKVLACLNYPGKIIAADSKSGRYQVRCDRDGRTDWLPARQLQFNCVGAAPSAFDQSYFVGRWSLFISPYPQYEKRGGNNYLVVGPGAKGGMITVNADGTYLWPDPKGPIRGRWRAMAPDEVKYGTRAPALLLIAGPNQMDWQMWRGNLSDAQNRDRIVIEGMKLGLSLNGTRVN